MKSHLTKEYLDYISSDTWKVKRWSRIHDAKGKCERCGASGTRLQVHHKHYDTLGEERPHDLEVLCIPCHKKADLARQADARYDAGLETYMFKKYGDDWGHWMDEGEAMEEFDDWLERHEE